MSTTIKIIILNIAFFSIYFLGNAQAIDTAEQVQVRMEKLEKGQREVESLKKDLVSLEEKLRYLEVNNSAIIAKLNTSTDSTKQSTKDIAVTNQDNDHLANERYHDNFIDKNGLKKRDTSRVTNDDYYPDKKNIEVPETFDSETQQQTIDENRKHKDEVEKSSLLNEDTNTRTGSYVEYKNHSNDRASSQDTDKKIVANTSFSRSKILNNKPNDAVDNSYKDETIYPQAEDLLSREERSGNNGSGRYGVNLSNNYIDR